MITHSKLLQSALVGALLFSLLFPGAPLLADPCGMVPPIVLTRGAPELTRVGDQITYVFHYQGIEDIVLRPAFKGSVHEFGMLIPFPSEPEIRKVADDIFSHIEKAIDPPEVVIDLRRRQWLARGAMDLVAPVLEMEELKFGKLEVLKEEAVGMYQVAVLATTDPLALKHWMETRGYAYPNGMDGVCQEYMDAGWCFVAVKANVGNKSAVEPRPGMRGADPTLPPDAIFEGAVQAMGFRFRIETPVVPMRLSAFNAGELHNIVYILSDQPSRIVQLPNAMVRCQIPGAQLLKNLTEPLPVKVLGGTLEDVEKMGLLAGYNRDPRPHNGNALELFASDLLAVRNQRLSHPFEEREKELLRIGERLGLRGAEVDQWIAEVIAKERQQALQEVREEFQHLTLSVVEGDFPRDVIAKENLTFLSYNAPAKPKSVEQGALPGSEGEVLACRTTPRGSSLPVFLGLCGLLAAVVIVRQRAALLVIFAASTLTCPALAGQ
ncbi:MAG: DUF2330 domain-containing protein, partial [Planctomycetota bacterium]